MSHELGHSILNLNPSFDNLRFDKIGKRLEDAVFHETGGVTIDHAAIWGLERDFLQKNGLFNLNGFFDNSASNQGIFNINILNSVTYRAIYEKIKILSVKIK